MSPRISVLVPCYNHGEWVDEAVASVQAQTLQDFEIIIVDDGSTEPATVRRLAAYAAPRTRVFRTENRGLPAARNHAASHATGELFCALDADDRLAPTWFEKAVAVLDAHPEFAFVSHWFDTFGDESWIWRPERCDLIALLAHNTINGAALVRRQAFESLGGYEESMREGCEDWDFWLRAVEGGFQGTIIPEVLFHYRRRADSMSRVMSAETGVPRPYATLLDRHASYYEAHLPELVAGRERESLQIRVEIHKLERDHMLVLGPQLARMRERARAAADKVARLRPAVETEIARAALDRQLNALQIAHEDLRGRYEALTTAHDRLAEANAGLTVLRDRALAERDDLLVQCRRLDDEREALLEDGRRVEAERERLGAALGALTASPDELEAAAGRVRAYADVTARQIAHLEGEVVALRRSLSWRITGPLRRVHEWLGRTR